MFLIFQPQHISLQNFIYDKYRVPIGIINSSFGGSPVEAWISESAIKKFPEYHNELEKYKDSEFILQVQADDNNRIKSWYNRLHQSDRGYKDPQSPWYNPLLDVSTGKQ